MDNKTCFFNHKNKMTTNWKTTILKWIFKNIIVPWVKAQIPPLPDWNVSEQVRPFFAACLRNETLMWIVQETTTKIDDNLLSFSQELVDNAALWETAWGLLNGEQKTLWQRIKERITSVRELQNGVAASPEASLGLTEIATLISLIVQVLRILKSHNEKKHETF